MLSFGDLGEPDMAHVEHALGAAHIEGEREVVLARKQLTSCVPWPWGRRSHWHSCGA